MIIVNNNNMIILTVIIVTNLSMFGLSAPLVHPYQPNNNSN